MPGSQQLEDIQGELYSQAIKKDLHADAVALLVRSRVKRLTCAISAWTAISSFSTAHLDSRFAAHAALDMADHIVVPFRPDFVSQFALDRVALLIERVENAEQLASIPFAERRYACLPNCLTGAGHERLLIEQIALDHPLLTTRLPVLDSIARAFDWDEGKKTMEQKYADALPSSA